MLSNQTSEQILQTTVKPNLSEVLKRSKFKLAVDIIKVAVDDVRKTNLKIGAIRPIPEIM